MTKARIRDQFLYALMAVVFSAVAILSIWNRDKVIVPAQRDPTEQLQVIRAQTPDQLMWELNKTLDDGGEAEFDSLKQESASL